MKLYLNFVGCFIIVFAHADIYFNPELHTVLVLGHCAMVMENTQAVPVNKHCIYSKALTAQQFRIILNLERLRDRSCAIFG